ncbi:MAG: NAD(P)-dependent oxidoreductase [Candidatus Omnitrophica bacterium]|jgi:nucleoside-diphosphate-sugar epimerase|nr:NAD(P)-dependent oxidoreductase [Candidatus Omnitrophota bacterium]
MKKVLLTGASGFIGRHTIPFLLEKKYEVHAVYIGKNKPFFEKNKRLFWHRCDLFCFPKQKKLLSEVKPTHLLHLAWDVADKHYKSSFKNISWVQLGLELLINFVNVGGKRAVGVGSCYEYGTSGIPCVEDLTPLKPNSLYGVCKNNLQQIFSYFLKQNRVSNAWGRIFYLYGDYQNERQLVSNAIANLLRNRYFRCRNGEQIKDYLYVEDAASALVNLLDSNVEGPVNIASGKPTVIKNIIFLIADLLRKRNLVEIGNDSLISEPFFSVANTKKLNEVVGWKPKFKLEDGIKKTIEWWQE